MKGDGVFVDRRSHWLGRIGVAGVSFSKYEGGAVQVSRDESGQFPSVSRHGGPLTEAALRLAVRLRLECRSESGSPDHGQTVLIRQENDPAPKVHFLEEGCVRLGMRVAFDLLDEEGHYHGDGRQDVWVYPEGDVHITWSVQTVDSGGHGPVADSWVGIEGDTSYTRVKMGDKELTEIDQIDRCAFGDELADKAILFTGPGETPAAVYWVRDEGQVWEVGSDHGPLPPFYASRWPTGMQQWSRSKMGWAVEGPRAGVTAMMAHDSEEDGPYGPQVRVAWLEGGSAEGDVTHSATLVVSLAPDEDELQRRIKATQNPLTPTVVGGSFRCCTEEDGTYEIGQGNPGQVKITFPPDPLERVARVRYYRRKTDPRHAGGIAATANGQALRPQLMSEGELTDDICVVMEMSHRNDSVDDVILAARLDAGKPTELVVEKVPGIQATYQSEIGGVDLRRRAGNRRDMVVWSNRNKQCPALELDLFSGAVHRVTQHGLAEPALWEVPMAWFRSCGTSKHDYCNFLEEFSIEENGPDRVSLYFRGVNPNGRAQSETWLSVPYDHPRVRMEVRMRMEVLEQWDYANVEFSDIFPYPSRLVETWFHDAVLFLQRDRSAMVYTYRPDKSVWSGAGESEDDRLFYGLYGTDRGNVLTLIRNPQHPASRLHYSVCGNYIDVHVNFGPPEAPVPAGTVYEVEYVTELYGDATTSVDEIRQIGLRSLEAGDLAVEAQDSRSGSLLSSVKDGIRGKRRV